jgi:hypothetical protein
VTPSEPTQLCAAAAPVAFLSSPLHSTVSERNSLVETVMVRALGEGGKQVIFFPAVR